jgi:hypothetical protein
MTIIGSKRAMQIQRRSRLVLPLLLLALAACDSDTDNAVPARTQSGPADVTSVDGDGNTSIGSGALATQLAALPLGSLDSLETAGILFMREEEKLARDVYSTLSSQWPQPIFANIAASEQTHTDAVLALITRYGLIDPVGSNPPGVFTDPVLQGLHDVLAARGSLSLIDGLIVGAEIEEIDIIDLDLRLADVVDNADVELVYQNLKKGSRNHLRAFVASLENQSYTYQPQHLTQQQFDAIVDSPIEQGGI